MDIQSHIKIWLWSEHISVAQICSLGFPLDILKSNERGLSRPIHVTSPPSIETERRPSIQLFTSLIAMKLPPSYAIAMPEPLDMQHLRSLLSEATQSLHEFAQSPAKFRILWTHPSSSASNTKNANSRLLVLDSSFNPPHLTHFQMIPAAYHSILASKPETSNLRTKIILLLATTNADKAPKPASFPHRAVMMRIFAEEVLKACKDEERLSKTENLANRKVEVDVDIAVTKFPYFIDKANALSEHYSDSSVKLGQSGSVPQTHLMGYDTLVRLLDPKYYDGKTLTSLSPLLTPPNLVRVTYRPGDLPVEQQDAYVSDLASGKREKDGAEKSWADCIELVKDLEGDGWSSTAVRDARTASGENWDGEGVPAGIAEWIRQEKLYLQD